MRISDWISDVCSTALFWDLGAVALCQSAGIGATLNLRIGGKCGPLSGDPLDLRVTVRAIVEQHSQVGLNLRYPLGIGVWLQADNDVDRSEEHTSELQSLMRISYAVFCLKKKNKPQADRNPQQYTPVRY